MDKEGLELSAHREDAECFECGVLIAADEITEIGGETLCWQCAEEHMRAGELREGAAAFDSPLPDGARVH